MLNKNTQEPILVFDIETIMDLTAARKLYPHLDELSDDDLIMALTKMREAEVGNGFLPLALHKVACLSMLWVQNDRFKLSSFCLRTHSEREILQTFFGVFERALPTLVSWNGKGFDIPVMSYRALANGVSAPRFFEEKSNDMKYNNYQNRYHQRHTDLMLKLATGGGFQKLDTVATICGFAGKMDIDGSQVVPMVQQGEWDKLTTYCESDVLNTYLVYIRYLLMTGAVDMAQADEMMWLVRDALSKLPDMRHEKFLQAWQMDGSE